jgi:hypothetical protein
MMKQKHTISTLSLSVATFAVSVTLAGCSMGGTFPDASVNPEQAPLGTIQGSNYGGHAPLTGSHVYVLQPSVSTSSGNSTSPQYNAYAAQATSILTSNTSTNSSGGYATQNNSGDPGIPSSWYYIATDSTGSFNISGDYTCTVGLPVYLYIYGGSPSYTAANTVSISSVTVTSNSYIWTSSNQNAYVGEAVTFQGLSSGMAGDNLNYLNNPGSPVGLTYTGPISSVTSNTVFTTPNPYGSGPGTFAQSGATATFAPTTNPGIVNLAVLGNCPSTGSLAYNSVTNPTGLKFVYVNEISTVAAAYAFQPFTSPANNNATYIGTSSTNIAGIQNAGKIAGDLYDIQGSNTSTTYAGEGHIARSATVQGNGIVPQSTIDEIGNILAACVDSSNTVTALGSNGSQPGGMSTPCYTLFSNATSTGIPATSTGSGANAPGTAPLDTAMAAINIARHPAGPPYSYSTTGSTAFMNALYGIPTGTNSPFAPTMTTQPNDFTIGILYTSALNAGPTASTSLTTAVESVAVDKIGHAWFTSQPSAGAGYLFEMSHLGVVATANTQYQSGWSYGYVAIDSTQSPWAGSATTANPVTYVQTSSTPAATSGTVYPTYTYNSGGTRASYMTFNGGYGYAMLADSTGDVLFPSNLGLGSNTSVNYIYFASPATNTSNSFISNALPDFTVPSTRGISHGAMDGAGAAYFDYNALGGSGTPQIGRNAVANIQTANGANASGTWPVTPSTTGCSALTDPEQMTVTRSEDAIVPDYYNGSGTLNGTNSNVFYITSAGACTALTSANMEAGFYSPYGAATDGNDYVYITNRVGNSISVLNTQAGTATGTVAVSPANGYQPQYIPSGGSLTNMLNGPLNVAIGPSGTLWITNFSGNSILELIGLAAPTTTPLASAAIPLSYTQGSIGYKP